MVVPARGSRGVTASFAAFALLGFVSESVLASPSIRNFTVFSAPVRLRYGEVYNTLQPSMALPKDVVDRYADGQRNMAVIGFDVDMVRVGADGSETKVTLDDHYLHHYALQLGSGSTMQMMLDAAAEDKSFARMLRGCHAMTRAGVHAFLIALDEKKKLDDGAPVAVFGSASGAEYRHNPQRFEAPFRRIIKRPEVWAPLLHVIRTKRSEEAEDASWSPLLECPCTPQRKFNVTAGTIDGKLADPPIHCSPEFAATGNPSCHLATYVGGWRCCEHEMFVIDTDVECASPDCSEKLADEVYMKFTFFYEDAVPETRGVEPAACCDVTSVTQGNENIEYDIPACAPGTPPEQCVHEAVSVQPLAYFGEHPKSHLDPHQGSDLVDLVFAAPHLHLAGLSLELIDDVTNETLCEVRRTADNSGGVMYGRGVEPGDERDYLVGLDTCRWGGKDARRFRRDHPMRTRARYNATQGHTGVMSLWLMDVAPVVDPDFLI
eukprot:TRINITY_DN23375_c0_g2_i3.p1 TRINITY_DN23375_c0_g2~~TRINITY_DN23375_c0_g2_i3.p1  ORF type:complete len:515 (+),score=78.67 TRINITY_DN23375_c0_g2_i3:75-1547(+)